MADEDDFPKMTMRVYTVTADGRITSDSGVRLFNTDRGAVSDYHSAYPPCRCPRHRPAKVRR